MLSQKKTNCYPLTHHNWKVSPHYLVKCTTFSSSSFFTRIEYTNARYRRVAEASCCDMGWISAQRGERCSWSVAKDWKHVSVQKVVTLNICCNVACLTFHMPHITTGFYRATACNATHGIAVGILSVRPSIRLSVRPSDACIVTKLNDALHIFLYDTKGQSFCYSDTNSGWWVMPPLKSALKVSPPFEKRRLRPISAHNVSTVGDSEKSSITTKIKSTTGFPTSHR